MFESALRTFVDYANHWVWETPTQFPWMVALLLGAGIFITFRMGWINIRFFKHSIDVIRGKFDNPEDSGDINHFQALSTALSATIGIGNIAGVALGIHYGGPGILLWMWISGIFGMSLKYSEATLAHYYRVFDRKGNASGGPMYYIERGLGKKWKWMAVLFAMFTIISSFGIGNMNQSNTVAVSAASEFHLPDWLVGIVLSVLVALVILGGIRRIGAVTSRLVPFMAVLYIFAALYILVSHTGQLPDVFARIVSDAIKPKAAYGGTVVGVWHFTLLWGIRRALFSNEAGMGSAPIAHAAAKTKEPVREGVVAMIGPFVDTLLICTLTGLVIVLTNVWDQKKFETRYLDAGKITIYEDKGPIAGDRILHSDDTLKPVLFSGRTRVVDGKAGAVLFEVNDAFVENPVLLLEDAPYTGEMIIENGLCRDADGNTLHLNIRGKMLQNSSELTAFAFFSGFKKYGKVGTVLVALCVFLFGISTIISWSYYGDRCVEYLFGARYVVYYRIVYVIFIYFGAILALETVWAYGDMALGLMVVPNLLGVLLLSPRLAVLTRAYKYKLLSGKQKETQE